MRQARLARTIDAQLPLHGATKRSLRTEIRITGILGFVIARRTVRDLRYVVEHRPHLTMTWDPHFHPRWAEIAFVDPEPTGE